MRKKIAVPDYLSGFSRSQLNVILEEEARKQVAAGAGSGKTRTVLGLVEHRLRSGLERPGGILLLSFSRKAAGELSSRLSEELRGALEISTFHSFCFRRLSRLHPRYAENPPRIMPENVKRDFYFDLLRREADEIGGVPFPLLLENPRLFRRYYPEVAMRTHRAFYAFKRRNGYLEYEDLISLMLSGLRGNEPYLESMRKSYDFIIVDEFQDTDPRQLDFLREMNPPRLAAVGDAAQAIYSFRGASVRPFLNFPKIFPGCKRYYLSENYRSLAPVVRLGNQIMRQARGRLPYESVSVRGKGPGLAPLETALPPGGEARLAPLFPRGNDFRLLVRSNFRARVWKNAGVPEDSIMTIHKSKGLEFPVVFLDLMGGWSGRAGSEEEENIDEEEEIRVAYVGVTRAMNLFVLIRKAEYRRRDREGALYEALFADRLKKAGEKELPRFLEKERKYREASG